MLKRKKLHVKLMNRSIGKEIELQVDGLYLSLTDNQIERIKHELLGNVDVVYCKSTNMFYDLISDYNKNLKKYVMYLRAR